MSRQLARQPQVMTAEFPELVDRLGRDPGGGFGGGPLFEKFAQLEKFSQLRAADRNDLMTQSRHLLGEALGL